MPNSSHGLNASATAQTPLTCGNSGCILLLSRIYGRAGAGHFGHADSQDACPTLDAWVGNRSAHPTGFTRNPTGGGGVALSGSAAAGARRLGHGRVGAIREQPPGAVLFAHRPRAQAVGPGIKPLG